MAHIISAKITRDPKIQQGQNSNGPYTQFLFELSEYHKGANGGENTYTNYSVSLFAKTEGAVSFHSQAIAKDSFVVISCDKLKIDISNPEYPKLRMENARLDGFLNPNQQHQQQAPQQNRPQQAQAQQAPAYQQHTPQYAPQPQYAQQQPQPQRAPTQHNAPSMDFDQDIPFAPIGLQYPHLLLSM